MKRVIFEFDCCDDCPFVRYDGDYGRSYDSGWDCHHEKGGFRIADEGGWETWKKLEGQRYIQGRLGQPFPDDCPLPDA
jgi:hypothetical protein